MEEEGETKKEFSVFDSVIERYYDQTYVTHKNLSQLPEGCDQYVHQHHNGLCVVGLSPKHFIFKLKDISILQVDFNVGNQNRENNKVRGKKKKGGIQLSPQTLLCRLKISYKDRQSSVVAKYNNHNTESGDDKDENEEEEEDESEEQPRKLIKLEDEEEQQVEEWINIYACIKGSLLQVNQRLLKEPELLLSKERTEGFIAIIMPKFSEIKVVTKEYIPASEYYTE